MGKGVMFMFFVWFAIAIAGNIFLMGNTFAATTLTADIDEDDDSIPVVSTTGFPDAGMIQIGDEQIAYSDTTATSFDDTLTSPMIRGASDTEAVSHEALATVRTVENAMLNGSVAYNVAQIADATGAWAALTIPLAVLRLLGNFLFAPLGWMGTDLAILTYLWAIIGIGMIVSIGIALAGGRRV